MKHLRILLPLLIPFMSTAQDTWQYAEQEADIIRNAGGGGVPDTVNLNITAAGSEDHNCGETAPAIRFTNDINMANIGVNPAPDEILATIYSVSGAELGPITRTSDSTNGGGAYNQTTYEYDSLCIEASARMIRHRYGDSITFTIEGWEADAECEVGLFGGGSNGGLGEFEVRIGTDNYTTTTMNSQGNALERFTGNADGSGVLTISLHDPVSTYVYIKIIQIVGPLE